ncbi:sensor histidine kinase [Nocardia carnea]|uniref:sensor histidine kinase n=1 Tax=Nocardia carnea TaxID=37328 RepID=UPI002458A45A|nr:histidine kinase [Nocardia carnea]
MTELDDHLHNTRPLTAPGWDLVLDLIAVIVLVTGFRTLPGDGLDIAHTSLLLGAGAAAALRRVVPLTAAIAGVILAAAVLGVPDLSLAVWSLGQICLLGLALRGRRTETVVVATNLAAVLYLGSVIVLGMGPFEANALVLPVWTAAVSATGLTVRAQRERLAALTAAASSAIAARDSDIERHVADERLRIARDLHDSVAHSMAVVSVHAGAAEHALPDRPRDALRAVREVRAASRAALGEMQTIVHLLRTTGPDGEEDLSAAPTPGRLVTGAAATGLRVTGSIPDDDALADLGAMTVASLSRVTRELLTNAGRHGTGEMTLDISVDEGSVRITAANPVAGRRHTERRGFGLVGIRERVAALDGQVHTSRGDKTFTIEIVIPRVPGKENEAQ